VSELWPKKPKQEERHRLQQELEQRRCDAIRAYVPNVPLAELESRVCTLTNALTALLFLECSPTEPPMAVEASWGDDEPTEPAARSKDEAEKMLVAALQPVDLARDKLLALWRPAKPEHAKEADDEFPIDVMTAPMPASALAKLVKEPPKAVETFLRR